MSDFTDYHHLLCEQNKNEEPDLDFSNLSDVHVQH